MHTPMEFADLFGGPAVLAKQLESRWLNHAIHVARGTKIANVPFLSRTLSYVRTQGSPSLGAGKGPWQMRGSEAQKGDQQKPYVVRERQNGESKQKTDILLQVFNHRTSCSNDALWSSPQGEAGVKSEPEESPMTPIKIRKEREDMPSPLAKVFDELEMAISHTVALSPNTVESKFGKAFPPYQPVEGGVWMTPEKPVTAFSFFCATNHYEAQRYLSRREREDEGQVTKQLEKMWEKQNSTSLLYWKQEEAWDKQRFLHESAIFQKARREAGLDTVKHDAIKAETPNKGGGAKVAGAKSKGKVMPTGHVFYHYIYMEQGRPAVQVEKRQDCRCPFCFSRCGSGMGLLIHSRITHGEKLSFEGAKDEEGNVHIAVRADLGLSAPKGRKINQLDDFTYIRSKAPPMLAKDIPFFQRPVHNAARLDPIERKRKAQVLESYGADKETISHFIPGDTFPIRPYYHSRTNLPMLEGDWLEDSDDEPDDTWLHKMGEELMDEFDDVSSQEKAFMKMWNRFMEGSHTVVSDRSMPKKCMTFIATQGHKLADMGLRQNLFLHLCNLWDEEVLSSSHILSCMTAYDDRYKERESLNANPPRGRNGRGSNGQRAGKKRGAPPKSNESHARVSRRNK